jgi:hypothetical protein
MENLPNKQPVNVYGWRICLTQLNWQEQKHKTESIPRRYTSFVPFLLHFAAAVVVVKDGDQTSSRKKVYTRTLLVYGLRLFIKTIIS